MPTMTPKQEQAALLIGLQLASAVGLALANGLEMGMPVETMKRQLKITFNELVDETTADLQLRDPALTAMEVRTRQELAEAHAALRHLTVAARTTGGVAGPDHGLMAACERAEGVLASWLKANTDA